MFLFIKLIQEIVLLKLNSLDRIKIGLRIDHGVTIETNTQQPIESE